VRRKILSVDGDIVTSVEDVRVMGHVALVNRHAVHNAGTSALPAY
jgi:hypothetical protein